jgi:hypothetical protein
MATIPNPVTNPLGPPAVSGTEITLDTLSKQPTRVTKMVADLTLQKFLLDRLFTSAGGVTGGAVIYDQVTENDLYLVRDIEKVAPGGKFPNVGSARLAPKVATVDKWGGKFSMTKEAMDRNDQLAFTNQVRKLGNTIVRKLNQYAVGVVAAAVSANTRSTTGHSWSGAIPPGYYGSSSTVPSNTPFGDLTAVVKQADTEEMGIVYDTLLVNPQEKNTLLNFMQFNIGNLRAVLADLGITDFYSSNRVTAGAPLLVASGQVGEFRIEQPLATESWYEPEDQETWWQSSVRPTAYVTNPFAIFQINGVA